jgi:hypothetical protein
MAIYFAFALVAAYTNQRIDAQQSMRLDDLNSSSFTTNTDNRRNIPSSGLSTSAAPIPMNNFGITFIDATPDSDSQPKITRCERPFEDREIHTNPFADPEDPEDPYRLGVGSQEIVAHQPKTR